MIDDGEPLKSASEALVLRQAGSCWLSMIAVRDGFFRVEVADQPVDHELGVRGVQAAAASIGGHDERVGDVGVGHLRPALRHRQGEVEGLEILRLLRLQLDVLAREEFAQRAGAGRGEFRRSRWCGDRRRRWQSRRRRGQCGRDRSGRRCGRARHRVADGTGDDGDGLRHRGGGSRVGAGREYRVGRRGGAGKAQDTGSADGQTRDRYSPATGSLLHEGRSFPDSPAGLHGFVEVAESDCNQGEAAASSTGIDLQHTWDKPLTGLQSNRDRRWSAGRSTPPL